MDQTRGVLVLYPTHVLGLIVFMTIILSVKANNASDLGIAADLVCVSGSRILPRDRKAPGLTASWGASRQGRSENMRISTEDVSHAIRSFVLQRNSMPARY